MNRDCEKVLGPCTCGAWHKSEEEFSKEPKIYKLYLAGPTVFLPNAVDEAEKQRSICREMGFEPLSPMDTVLNDKNYKSDHPYMSIAKLIYKFDCSLMNAADGGVIDISPFRGPSCDVGTAFELGYLTAQGKPVVGYSSDLSAYKEKFAKSGISDQKYTKVEDFGLTDNLMITESLRQYELPIMSTFKEAVRILATLMQPCHPCHDRCQHAKP